MPKIDFTKLKRNYLIDPLKIGKSRKNIDIPFFEDLEYLYITLNLTKGELANFFKCSLSPINRWLKFYKLEKSNEKRIESIIRVLEDKHKDPNYQISINNKREQKNLLLYGVKNCFQSEDKKRKIKDKILKKFGVTNCSQSIVVKNKKSETSMLNWGVDNPSKSSIVIQRIRNKKIQNHTTNAEVANDKDKQIIIRRKNYESRKLHNTFKSSKIELELYKLLLKKFPKTIHTFTSKEYPFNCDFYIPELKLYIEYQGFWTHGPYHCHEPFDPNNSNHLKLLKKLQLKSEETNCFGKKKDIFFAVINTWTKSDPLKRKTARENKLNWFEFFNLKDFMNWYNNI